jgi:hypothetical protein
MRRQELSGSVRGGGRFVEDRVKVWKTCGTGGDVEGDLDMGGGGMSRQADGIVEENLMGSGLDDERRQGQPVLSGVDQGGDGEPPPADSAAKAMSDGRCVLQEGFVGGQNVVDCGWIRMLGAEPVSGRNSGRLRSRSHQPAAAAPRSAPGAAAAAR